MDPEQDKKERNCAASARFRKKKREQYLVCTAIFNVMYLCTT